ncbi:toxin-antitoxin system YwqK family antitoxin [Pseudomonas sp. NPDC090202]|uniref:toxin-antitoxin system YwqK family antitoxin n=1 Tax=Pseudomonas sp. NPDC090202 TaxID=3364476 RepID=UPI00381069B9
MKKIAVLFFLVLISSLSGCSSKKLEFKNAKISNGKIYQSGENTPFTGQLTNIPETAIKLNDGFNGLLMEFNQGMEASGSSEERLIGRLLICDAEIEEGYLSGPVTCLEPKNSIKRYTANYETGKLNGEVTIYSQDGAKVLSKGGFKNDLRDGKSEVFGPHNGKLIGEYHTQMGKIDGDQTSWDENSRQKTYHATTINGLYVGSLQMWSPAGVLIADVPFVNGMRSGLVKTWFENGKPKTFVTMIEGYREGASRSWDEQGNIVSSGTYKREVWYPDSDEAYSSQKPSENETCEDNWIAAFHKTNGEDTPITSEQLGEWEDWCQKGKKPQ